MPVDVQLKLQVWWFWQHESLFSIRLYSSQWWQGTPCIYIRSDKHVTDKLSYLWQHTRKYHRQTAEIHDSRFGLWGVQWPSYGTLWTFVVHYFLLATRPISYCGDYGEQMFSLSYLLTHKSRRRPSCSHIPSIHASAFLPVLAQFTAVSRWRRLQMCPGTQVLSLKNHRLCGVLTTRPRGKRGGS